MESEEETVTPSPMTRNDHIRAQASCMAVDTRSRAEETSSIVERAKAFYAFLTE